MENEGKLDVAARARMMSRRLKVMNKSPALIKLEEVDDDETKRLLVKRGGKIRSSARHNDDIKTRMKRFNLDASKSENFSSNKSDDDEEVKPSESVKVNLKEKLAALQSSMQQGDKNTLTLANHRFERGGHESVRNIKMTLSSRKKNLQEQQILKALQNNRAKEGSAPVPLPRHKRVISVRKRSQKELQLSPNDGGVEETNDDSEMNKAVPRKPPRRKLRISTVRRVNREEGHQQVMDMIEEKKTSAEELNEEPPGPKSIQEKPVPQKRKLRIRRSSSKIDEPSKTSEERGEETPKSFRRSQRSSPQEGRQKVSRDNIIDIINAGTEIVTDDEADDNKKMSKPKKKRSSRTKYREKLLQTYLAAGEPEEKPDVEAEEGAASVEQEVTNNCTLSSPSHITETPTRQIPEDRPTQISKPVYEELRYSVDDINQVLEISGDTQEHQTPSDQFVDKGETTLLVSPASNEDHSLEDVFNETNQGSTENISCSSEKNTLVNTEGRKLSENEIPLLQNQDNNTPNSTITDAATPIASADSPCQTNSVNTREETELQKVDHTDVELSKNHAKEAGESNQQLKDDENLGVNVYVHPTLHLVEDKGLEEKGTGNFENKQKDVQQDTCIESCSTGENTAQRVTGVEDPHANQKQAEADTQIIKEEPRSKMNNKHLKVLKKATSFSEGIISSSDVNPHKFFQFRIKNFEIEKKSCYVQTDESFILSQDIERKQQVVKNTEKEKSIQNLPILTSDENQVQVALVQDDKLSEPHSLKHLEETIVESNSSGNIASLPAKETIIIEETFETTDTQSKKKEVTEKESESAKDNLSENDEEEFEVEYLYVDEDGNELPVDEAMLTQGISLLEGSDDELELVYEDESGEDDSEELTVYLDDDGNYVDENGQPVELDDDSENEWIYEVEN